MKTLFLFVQPLLFRGLGRKSLLSLLLSHCCQLRLPLLSRFVVLALFLLAPLSEKFLLVRGILGRHTAPRGAGTFGFPGRTL